MGLLDFFTRQQAPQQQTPNQAVNYNTKPRLGGLIDAIGYGLSPQGFTAGRTAKQNRIIGGINNEAEQLRAAQQFGRTDIMEQLAERQKLRREAEQRRMEQNRAAIVSGAYRDRFGGVMSQQAPMQPQLQMGGGINPQMQQEPQQALQDSAMQAQPWDGISPQQSETVNIYGQRGLHGGEFTKMQDRAGQLREIALRLYNGGDKQGANEYFALSEAEAVKQEKTNSQLMASIFGAVQNGYKTPDDPKTQVDESSFGAQRAIRELNARGIQLPQAVIDGLTDRDPNIRNYYLQSIINQGSIEDAAKQNIETQGKWNAPPEYMNVDNGGSNAAFNKRTGRQDNVVAKSVDPTARLNNNTRIRTTAMNNAVQTRGQDIQAQMQRNAQALRALEIRISRSQGAERIALQRQAQGLQRENTNLRAQELQWNRSIGAKADVGDPVDINAEGWN